MSSTLDISMQYGLEACSEELHTFFCYGKFAAQAIFKPTCKYLSVALLLTFTLFSDQNWNSFHFHNMHILIKSLSCGVHLRQLIYSNFFQGQIQSGIKSGIRLAQGAQVKTKRKKKSIAGDILYHKITR